MANIGIIADVLYTKNPNGIKRYTRELISSLLEIDKQNKVFFIYSKGNFGPLVRNFIQLPFVLNHKNLDIVHEPTHLGPFFYGGRYKKVITIHDLSPLVLPETRPNSYFTWLRHKLGLPILLNKVDAIIAVSENTKRDLIKWFRIPDNKISVIYEAADNRFKRMDNIDVRSKHPFILSVGTLEPRKNLVTLIKAFHICRTRYGVEHKLIIIGKSGWKYKDIFFTIKNLNLESEIKILQHIGNEELVCYYNLASLFVYPSLYEGFGLPVLEAMQCGCPVIASNTSSLPEIAGDAGILIQPNDIECLAKTIVKILEDKGLRNSMSKHGVEQSKKFSWEKTAEGTMKVYESLL